jgi:hypothetical protein
LRVGRPKHGRQGENVAAEHMGPAYCIGLGDDEEFAAGAAGLA